MKIVFLSFYQGYIPRGMETIVHELAKRLAKKHQVMMIQAGPKYSSQKTYMVKRIKMNMEWPEIDSAGWIRKLMIDYFYRKIGVFSLKTWPLLKEYDPDMVIPVNGGWMSFLMKLFCLMGRGKLILLGQAGIGWDDRWNLMQKPDLFVALNKRNLMWSKKHSRPGQKLAVIPNGVDLKKFSAVGDKIKLRLEKPIVLCVAGHERYKRVKETISAVKRLNKGSLVLACSSSVYDDFGKKELAKRFLRREFKHQEMPKVYRSADIFTLVSESFEAFGIAYLEAMASGLPVVATDDQMRREIIGKAGLFVKDLGNSQEYVQKLEKALRIEWGDKPRKQAEKYSWDKITQRYEKEFNKLYEAINK